MSGSPIIQNGKLVGAMTYVLVNDSTRGYGIYIENTLAVVPYIQNKALAPFAFYMIMLYYDK